MALDPAGGAFWSPGDAFEVRRLDSSLTRVTAIMRYPVPARRVATADRRAFQRYLDAQKHFDRSLRRAVDQAVDSAGFPDVWPAIAELKVAGPGSVWALRAHAIGAPQEWDVLTQGRHRFTVVAPSRLRVMDVRANRVLGVLTDELDVEYIALYSVPDPGR